MIKSELRTKNRKRMCTAKVTWETKTHDPDIKILILGTDYKAQN